MINNLKAYNDRVEFDLQTKIGEAHCVLSFKDNTLTTSTLVLCPRFSEYIRHVCNNNKWKFLNHQLN